MFRKKKNASSNLKRGLHLGTKIKSNGCLDIGTEGNIKIRKFYGEVVKMTFLMKLTL